MKYVTLVSFLNFLIYTGASLALLGIFTWLYTLCTPYDEFEQMRRGKKAPAYALGGAMLGFIFPFLSLSYHGVNLWDFMIWSLVVGFVQVVLFKILYGFIPMRVDEDNQAVGIFYAFAAVCVGLVCAFSLIPN